MDTETNYTYGDNTVKHPDSFGGQKGNLSINGDDSCGALYRRYVRINIRLGQLRTFLYDRGSTWFRNKEHLRAPTLTRVRGQWLRF